jgi:hypothetical protein
MGEAANKIIRTDDVANLRKRIDQKRQEIAIELAVLRERRTKVVGTAQRAGLLAGVAAVGVLCVASLANAFVDLFAEATEEQSETAQKLSGTMAMFALMALRILATRFIRTRIERIGDRLV